MNRIEPLAILVVLGSLAAAQTQERPPWAITVEPACPVVSHSKFASPSRELRVSYFPHGGSAKLREPQALRLELAFNGASWADRNLSIAFTKRNDDVWEATVPLREPWTYAIFMVKDDKTGAIDDNGGKYWDVLFCDPTGERNALSVGMQAESYAGNRLGPGIQRAPDYGRAVAILEAALPIQETLSNGWAQNLFSLWQYRVQRDGLTDAAYAKQAKEISQFLTEHKDRLDLLSAAANYVGANQSRQPANLLEQVIKAIEALDPKSAAFIRITAEYNRIIAEPDVRAKADALDVFITKHPNSDLMESALAFRFSSLWQLGDVPAAEETFRKMIAFQPDKADSYAAMAAVYIQRDEKLDQALKWLDRAQELSSTEMKPGGHVLNVLPLNRANTSAALAYWRAQALRKLKRPAEALPLAEQAAHGLNDTNSYYELGRVYEDLGKTQDAVDAYLQSVVRYGSSDSGAMQRLTDLFLGRGLGSQNDLNTRIMKLRSSRLKEAKYVPRIVDRRPPDYAFQTTSGENLRPDSLKGKTVILNFWSTWCGPCIAELPDFQELQQRHPELVVAAVALNSPAKDISSIIQRKGLSSLRVVDAPMLHDAFGIGGVPITYLLDGNGHIRIVHDADLPDVITYIEQDLKALKEETTN